MKGDFQMNYILYVLVLFLVCSCGGANTQGFEKNTDLKIVFNITQEKGNKGDININPDLGLKSGVGDVGQETENSSTIDPKTNLLVPTEGAIGTIAEKGANSIIKDTVTKIDKRTKVDNTKTDSDNDFINEPVKIITPDKDEEENIFDSVEEYTLKWNKDRKRLVTWMNQDGSKYGDKINFTLDGDCKGEYLVQNDEWVNNEFEVVDDFHYSHSSGHGETKAEVLAPKKCTKEMNVKMTVTFKGA